MPSRCPADLSLRMRRGRQDDKALSVTDPFFVMFKGLVLQHPYNLADEQTECQIRDRHSFCRFLGMTPEGQVPGARWTKNHGQTHCGCKYHISIDRKHKLIRHFEATSASVADNTVFDALLDPTNTGAHVWTDAACRPVLAGSHSRMPATAATSTPRARRTDRSRRVSSAPIASAQNTVVAWSMSLPRSMRWLPCWGKVRNCL